MGMKYIGGGAFVPPYPARDLTDAEVETFGAEALMQTGLYEAPSEETKKPVIKKAKE
jgi:hypothetical protein